MTYTNATFKGPINTVCVAREDFLTELCEELGQVSAVVGDLVFTENKNSNICFAQDTWYDPQIVTFESISEATKILQKAGKFWYLHKLENVRRSLLIQEGLRKLPSLTIDFPLATPIPPIGCFTLLDKNTLLYATQRAKKAPSGIYQFIEDKINPPNRAYLKLWEALTLLEQYPEPNALAIDLGASPGGWTYVMQSLGARVIAVDKAELEPRIAKLPRVSYLQKSAFALDPNDFDEPIEWLLSDVACYPERLYDFTLKWIASNKVKRIIFTIKLQGETNLEIIKKFQAIPGGKVVHLTHNKHEVTFFW